MAQALIGQELSDLNALLAERGEPAYRARQLYHALYRRRSGELSEVNTLPAGLRETLAREHAVGLPRVEQRIAARDGTTRYLLGLDDGKSVEAVFIPERTRDTLCISSQVGCPVDCKFCLTALMGLERHLTAGEIVGQTLALCRAHGLEPTKRPLNIVMMGMGEPLLNLDNVLKAVRLMGDPEGVGIPLRRITVSTSGIIPKIEELGREEIRPKLAISLNASTEEQRRQVMPLTKKYHLADLLEACRRYPLRPWEKLTFEYVLLGGFNDSDEDARRVVGLLGQMRCKVNLIALNPGPGIDFETPAPERVQSFQEIVARSVPCFVRQPRGREIYAACGQLKRTTA
ncbi:MAG: 23S rRNA (adenine(2503)-C(2))-methyltransferase RlmN [Bryobacterales bacterium]